MAGLRRRKASGRQAEIGPHAGAITAAILNKDTRHNGGWTLMRLCAEIAHRGRPAISPWRLAVIFQQVVHSVRTGQAAVAELCMPGRTEWTSTRMHR
jgi:hypothetical protein